MLTHDMPNIVKSNHVAQVKRQLRISWTESRECALYFCASRIACAKNINTPKSLPYYIIFDKFAIAQLIYCIISIFTLQQKTSQIFATLGGILSIDIKVLYSLKWKLLVHFWKFLEPIRVSGFSKSLLFIFNAQLVAIQTHCAPISLKRKRIL